MSSNVSITSVCKVTQAISPLSNAAGAVTDTEINGTGYDRALFIIDVGTMANAGASLATNVWEATTSGSNGTAITGSLQTVAATSGASESYLIDVPVASTTPYLKLFSTAATGFVNVSATCLLYNGSGLYPKSHQNTATVVY